MTLTYTDLLRNLPISLKEELITEFNKLLKNYREGKWEPAELNGGKLCEIIYSIIKGYISGSYPISASKPSNFYDSCKAFETASSFPRSVRIQVPRILIALYEVRNNRGVGHVGGDVNPNRMDATFVLSSAKWLISELIRIFHGVNVNEAEEAIELIIQRETEFIWNIGTKKRVLVDGLDYKMQVLLLLYNCIDGKASDDELFDWIEYSNKSSFKTKLLKALHDDRLIEYDSNSRIAHISPKGISLIEEAIK
jgi:hypothetical protein